MRVWVVVCIATVLSFSAFGQETERVSVDSTGSEGNGTSQESSLSEDGRFVTFSSTAANLVPGDTNGHEDVFVRDRQTGITTRVSVDSNGVEANRLSESPSISADGRFVAFESYATNLVQSDTNWSCDVFVHDCQTGTTTRVSVDSTGVPGNDHSSEPSISHDGRFLAFDSHADNLASGDTNGVTDVFVHDRQTGATTRLSLDSAGVEGNGHSDYPSISGDGQVVAFCSWANNLAQGDTNGTWDIFAHDLRTGSTIRVSVSSAGDEADNWSDHASTSGDGRFVAFDSVATNLAHCDKNGVSDVFVHDLQDGTTTRVSVHSKGGEGNGNSRDPSISADGRCVAFYSWANNLVRRNSDTNDKKDIFVHERSAATTTRASVASSGDEADDICDMPAISADGRVVSFRSLATNLVHNDTNVAHDNFVHGPYLTMEVSPDTVTTGDTIELTTWTGAPNGLFFLVLVDFNDKWIFRAILKSTFDGAGIWSLQATTPPGLAGNVMTLQSLGIAPSGKADLSNEKTVTFQ